MFEKLWAFYYTYVEDTVEKVTDPIRDGLCDLLPSEEKIDKFYGNIEKKGDRFFDNLYAIVSDTPYIDGKEKGYNLASTYYIEEYELTKKFYTDALVKVKNRKNTFSTDKEVLEYILKRRKSDLKVLEDKKSQLQKRVSKITNKTIYELEEFELIPENRTVLDLIASKKLREVRFGYYDGYMEAKRLYSIKLESLRKEFETELNDKIIITKQYIDIYDKIIKEIDAVGRQTVALSILEEKTNV